jgi:hypothetical protein
MDVTTRAKLVFASKNCIAGFDDYGIVKAILEWSLEANPTIAAFRSGPQLSSA